jgi:hypothetical protein
MIPPDHIPRPTSPTAPSPGPTSIDDLRTLLKDLAAFFDAPGTGTVAFEAEEYFGFQNAAGWLSDTLSAYAARIPPPTPIPAATPKSRQAHDTKAL